MIWLFRKAIYEGIEEGIQRGLEESLTPTLDRICGQAVKAAIAELQPRMLELLKERAEAMRRVAELEREISRMKGGK